MNILLWLAYKGTNYSGFQVQPNGVTVCAVVQDAMQSVFGTRPDVKGCSRTDAGVHARRFALNFHYDGRIPVQRIPLALNARLPMDVRALAAQQVPDDFHARYAAHAKTYHYRLRCSAVDDPFDYETCHRVNGPLNLAAMQAAASHFVGRHDFLALCASGSSAAAHGDTVRTITACTVQQDGELYTLSVTADGYLYNMVRILAGTVLQAGLGKMNPAAVPALLQSRNRGQAGPTLPARGSTWVGVRMPVLAGQPAPARLRYSEIESVISPSMAMDVPSRPLPTAITAAIISTTRTTAMRLRRWRRRRIGLMGRSVAAGAAAAPCSLGGRALGALRSGAGRSRSGCCLEAGGGVGGASPRSRANIRRRRSSRSFSSRFKGFASFPSCCVTHLGQYRTIPA